MADPSLIWNYFPELSPVQRHQIELLYPIYTEWNEKINVISRKDMDHFYERHVLHSLAIARVIQFEKGARVLDIGTGGGFPGIPLAILFPEVHFHLVDSIGKKLKVAEEAVKALGLNNVQITHARAEQLADKYDFIVSRAVTAMPQFITWTQGKFLKENKHVLKNGILYLKGGDLKEEMADVKKAIQYFEIRNFFSEEFFETKKVVYVRN